MPLTMVTPRVSRQRLTEDVELRRTTDCGPERKGTKEVATGKIPNFAPNFALPRAAGVTREKKTKNKGATI